METCRFFAQGRCAFGTACRLSHALPAGTAAGRCPPAPEPPPRQPPQPPPRQPPLQQQDPYNDYSEQWDQAVASTWAGEEEEATVDTKEAERKERGKLQKAMREIVSLEEKRAAGQKLALNQFRKIEKKAEYSQRLAELEELLRVEGPPEEANQPQSSAASSPMAARPAQSQPLTSAGYPAAPPPPPVPRGHPAAAGKRRGVVAASSAPMPVCPHFLSGRCSFGDACRQSHYVGDRALGETSQRGKPEPSFDVDDPECGICFESIKKKGERYGILESCDHAFCLGCIRSWRKQREQQDRQNLRLCPVCRNESFFVVPSDEIIMDPVEKSRVIEAYQNEMGRIPCKLFDYGKGKCPFGNSCFYAHLNPDGTRYVPAPLRWRNGADGSEVIGEVKLSDFLARSLAI